MRAFRIGGYWLILFPLLGILGCGGSVGYVQKGAEVKTNTVTINNCNATPDTVQVNVNDTLTWIVDSTDKNKYSVQFNNKTPFNPSGTPLYVVPPGQGQPVTGDSACKYWHWLSASYCVYPYNLIQVGVKTCPDPGVHVTPP